MSGLAFCLVVRNEGEEMQLCFDALDDGSIAATLLGTRDGKYLQIDFNDLSAEEATDLAAYISHRSKQAAKEEGK